jgi:hypothetical protein
VQYLGIDVGAAGGLALLDAAGRVQWAKPMPEDDLDLLTLLMQTALDETEVVLEAVHSSPQMGVTSAFSFGQQAGRVRMALVATRLAYRGVTPMMWQRRMECVSGGDKNVTKARAQGLWPGLKVTHKIADALLLAEYGRRFP